MRLIPALLLLALLLPPAIPDPAQAQILNQPIQQQRHQILDGNILTIAWSPDGTRIAVSTKVNSLYIFDHKGVLLKQQLLEEGIIWGLAWSPDSKYLAAIGYNNLYVFDANGNIIWKNTMTEDMLDAAWSPDGKYLAAGGGRSLYVFDQQGNQLWRQKLDGRVWGVAWSPDGLLAVGTYGYSDSLYVFDQNGSLLWSWEIDGDMGSIAWSPDGDKISIRERYYGYIYVFDKNGNLKWRVKLFGSTIVVWSPNGRYLAAGTSGNSLYVFDQSGNLVWSRVLDGGVDDIAWSPDGKYLAAGVGRSLYVFDQQGNQLWVRELDGGVDDIAWSPDGTKIAVGTGYRGYSLYVFNANGDLLLKLDNWDRMAWHPEGSKMIVGLGQNLYIFIIAAVLNIICDAPVVLEIEWDNNFESIHVNPGSTTIYLVPNNYLISYRISKPVSFIGDPNILMNNITITVKVNETIILELPEYEELLGKLMIEAPEDTRIVIEWTNGSAEYDGGVISIWAAPGLYNITVEGEGWRNVSSIEIVPGSVVKLAIKPPQLTPPEMVTTTTPFHDGKTMINESTNTYIIISPTIESINIKETYHNNSIQTTFSRNYNNRAETIEQETTIVIASREDNTTINIEDKTRAPIDLPNIELSLLGIGVIGASIVYYILRSHGKRKPKKAIKNTQNTVSIEELKRVLGRPLAWPAQEPDCSEPGFTARLIEYIAPEGFEGEWKCCLLGCGGWGCAYKCSRDGKTVVFKLPRGLEGILRGEPLTVSKKLLEKATREAETIGKLSHRHLLKLLAYSRNAPLLVYEYGNRGSLQWQLDNGWKPKSRDIVILGIQLGDALRYIHSRGLVHGDLKPVNILIAKGIAKLGDFSSITKLLSQASKNPTPAFTPGWRAPEQVYSDLRRRSAEMGLENRADVYQLGNLLLYLLTGEHVDGEEAAAGQERLREALARVGDRELRELLGMMLALEPWSRPGMEEVVSRLLGVLKRLEG